MPTLASVHHVGIACRDLERTRAWVHQVYAVTSDSGVVHDPIQHADLCLLTIDGGPAIELVAGDAVAQLLKRGHSYYHLCHEVPEIDAAIKALETDGCRLVSGPVPAVLFDGRPVAFLLGPTGLIEVLEQ